MDASGVVLGFAPLGIVPFVVGLAGCAAQNIGGQGGVVGGILDGEKAHVCFGIGWHEADVH
ncbi:MAG: hypothetical protein ACK55I_28365, partial [bacterium]